MLEVAKSRLATLVCAQLFCVLLPFTYALALRKQGCLLTLTVTTLDMIDVYELLALTATRHPRELTVRRQSTAGARAYVMSGFGASGCKVFVGGLSWEPDEDKLRAYFENFGAVTEVFVSGDRQTTRPRG